MRDDGEGGVWRDGVYDGAMIAVTALVGVSFAALLLAVAPASEPATEPSTQPARSLRVTTFNIRTGGAPDGEDAWPKRKHIAEAAMRAHDADIFGLQEVVHGQRLDL